MSEAQPHVLVIDDDKRLRDLIARYLTEQGYRVTTAVDAADARAKLAGITFDLLVVDVMMPGESGLELTQSLRESSLVPILLLTAMGESGDRIAGLETGADDYLVKPFEPRELVLRIKRDPEARQRQERAADQRRRGQVRRLRVRARAAAPVQVRRAGAPDRSGIGAAVPAGASRRPAGLARGAGAAGARTPARAA